MLNARFRAIKETWKKAANMEEVVSSVTYSFLITVLVDGILNRSRAMAK
jgi:hypothetical protein